MRPAFFIFFGFLTFLQSLAISPHPTVFASHISSQCDCILSGFMCTSHELDYGQRIHTFTPRTGVKSFLFKNKISRGQVGYYVLDEDNFQKYCLGQLYESAELESTDCDDMFIEMNYNDTWYILASCESAEGCSLRMLVIVDDCSTKESKSSCMTLRDCGWCENLNGTETETDVCVRSISNHAPFHGLQCDQFYTFWGVYGIYIIIVIVFLVLLVLGACFCWIRGSFCSGKNKSTKSHESLFISLESVVSDDRDEDERSKDTATNLYDNGEYVPPTITSTKTANLLNNDEETTVGTHDNV
eukprot:TRINITY_DN1934_c0_g1_i1.p1 TRINITY_DN1934_c0_g1~~TRINITY_DN1934_c0_g1_i1.p1  ORF type:complete len:300 (+),score=43.42 TRINITY_DN1934_c0_g1_i1:65-964(+)